MKLRFSLMTALFTLGLGACDPATDGGSEHAAGRGPIGKADAASGSCAATEDGPTCGGPAPVGNCWCDASCEDFGDCCLDAFDECGVGQPQPAVSQCLADEHCAAGQTCAGGVCIGEPLAESCGDGSPLHPLCDIAPVCPTGTEMVVINGCFQCVDPQTCEPPAPASEPCDDGSAVHPLCDIKPGCDDGEVAAVINGCFQCVDAQTCE